MNQTFQNISSSNTTQIEQIRNDVAESLPSSSISKSQNLEVEEIFTPIIDYILNLKGGGFEGESESQKTEKLVQSMIHKTPQSSESKMSINKVLQKIVKIGDPVISSPKFWKIVRVATNPIESEFSVSREGMVLTSSLYEEKDNQLETEKKSSSFFAEGFTPPNPGKKHKHISPIEKGGLNMDQNVNEGIFSNGLRPSGLSVNHETFPEDIKEIENKTRFRREAPLYPSKALSMLGG